MRQAVAVFALAATFVTAPGAAANEWYVVCDPDSGLVTSSAEFDESTQRLLTGPVPGPRTAAAWIEANCPSRRCDGSGRCIAAADETGDSWHAGPLTTVSAKAAPAPQTATSERLVVGPEGPAGPGTADLTPLVNTAKAAVAGCSYPAALAAANHMSQFDPGHPWLRSNHELLRRLAERQQRCQESVWQAARALEAGDLDRAQHLAMTASDHSVSCQTQAVSALAVGIDTAIAQQRAAKDAARRRAAAALLPGLLDLARIASGGAPTVQDAATATDPMVRSAIAAASGLDICAFRLEYSDPSSVVPRCTCAGYAFDLNRFQCAPR